MNPRNLVPRNVVRVVDPVGGAPAVRVDARLHWRDDVSADWFESMWLLVRSGQLAWNPGFQVSARKSRDVVTDRRSPRMATDPATDPMEGY